MPPDQPGQSAADTTAATPRDAPSASAPPPEPRSYQAVPPEDRISRYPADIEPRKLSKPKRKGILARMWPFRGASEPVYLGEHNPARGMQATQRVVREGVLDPRYKAAATRFTVLICATPIMLYLSYELYQRRFSGKGQKRRPVVAKSVENDGR